MPFIDSKITVSLTPEKEESIKAKLGEAWAVQNWTREHMFLSVCLARHHRLPIQK